MEDEAKLPTLCLNSAKVTYAPGVNPAMPKEVEFIGCAIPEPELERYDTDDERANSFTLEEREQLILNSKLIGTDIAIEHNYVHLKKQLGPARTPIVVGKVTEAWLDEKKRVMVKGKLDMSNWAAHMAAHEIQAGNFNDLSLGHLARQRKDVRDHLGNPTYNKEVLELSIVKEGNKEKTHITSLHLASKQESLESEEEFEKELVHLTQLALMSGKESTPATNAPADASKQQQAAQTPAKQAPPQNAPAETEDDPMEEEVDLATLTAEASERLNRKQLRTLAVTHATKEKEARLALAQKEQETAAEKKANEELRKELEALRKEKELEWEKQHQQELTDFYRHQLTTVLNELFPGKNHGTDLSKEQQEQAQTEAQKRLAKYKEMLRNPDTAWIANMQKEVLALNTNAAKRELEERKKEQKKQTMSWAQEYLEATGGYRSKRQNREEDETPTLHTPPAGREQSQSKTQADEEESSGNWLDEQLGLNLNSKNERSQKKGKTANYVRKGQDLHSLGMVLPDGSMATFHNCNALLVEQFGNLEQGLLKLNSKKEQDEIARDIGDIRFIHNEKMMKRVGLGERWEEMQVNRKAEAELRLNSYAEHNTMGKKAFDRNGNEIPNYTRPTKLPKLYENNITMFDWDHKQGMRMLKAIEDTTPKARSDVTSMVNTYREWVTTAQKEATRAGSAVKKYNY